METDYEENYKGLSDENKTKKALESILAYNGTACDLDITCPTCGGDAEQPCGSNCVEGYYHCYEHGYSGTSSTHE